VVDEHWRSHVVWNHWIYHCWRKRVVDIHSYLKIETLNFLNESWKNAP
jgi:hypothetical protein